MKSKEDTDAGRWNWTKKLKEWRWNQKSSDEIETMKNSQRHTEIREMKLKAGRTMFITWFQGEWWNWKSEHLPPPRTRNWNQKATLSLLIMKSTQFIDKSADKNEIESR